MRCKKKDGSGRRERGRRLEKVLEGCGNWRE